MLALTAVHWVEDKTWCVNLMFVMIECFIQIFYKPRRIITIVHEVYVLDISRFY